MNMTSTPLRPRTDSSVCRRPSTPGRSNDGARKPSCPAGVARVGMTWYLRDRRSSYGRIVAPRVPVPTTDAIGPRTRAMSSEQDDRPGKLVASARCECPETTSERMRVIRYTDPDAFLAIYARVGFRALADF